MADPESITREQDVLINLQNACRVIEHQAALLERLARETKPEGGFGFELDSLDLATDAICDASTLIQELTGAEVPAASPSPDGGARPPAPGMPPLH